MANTSNKLVAALLSAATAIEISSYEDVPNAPENEVIKRPVDLANLHSILLKKGPVSNDRPSRTGQIFIRSLAGKTIIINCNLTETVAHLKLLIRDVENVETDQQRLIFGGENLKDERLLSYYKIVSGSTVHLVLRLRGGGGSAVWLYLDPKFRGGYVYRRPIGTIRIALNVMDKYGNNSWLGVNGRRSNVSQVPGEWAVSYHGTGMNNANSIAADGYLLCKGRRFLFGHGIYSTPDIAVALRYAATFTHENEQYKFVVQNRVNPETVNRVPTSETGVGEYWITEEEKDIRPYGICFLKC